MHIPFFCFRLIQHNTGLKNEYLLYKNISLIFNICNIFYFSMFFISSLFRMSRDDEKKSPFHSFFVFYIYRSVDNRIFAFFCVLIYIPFYLLYIFIVLFCHTHFLEKSTRPLLFFCL